jgi:hypothetical protein
MFPEDSLPPALDTSPMVPVAVADVAGALKRVRKARAPGLSGWTRELISSCFYALGDPQRLLLAEIVGDVVNGAVSPQESRLLLDTICVPFLYRAKQGKIRPIQVGDVWLKLAWRIVMAGMDFSPFEDVGQMGFAKGGSARAVHVIQAAVDAGRVVVACDARNAFNTASRHAALAFYASSKMCPLAARLINWSYCTEANTLLFSGSRLVETIPVTAGTRQGCVSGPWVYAMSTHACLARFPKSIVAIADDVHIVSNDSLEVAAAVFEQFATVGQKIDGEKTRVLMKEGASLGSRLPRGCRLETVIGGFPTVLGVCVNATMRDVDSVAVRARLIQPVRDRIESVIKLDTSVQNKYLILMTLQWSHVYAASAAQVPDRDEFFEDVTHEYVSALARLVRSDLAPDHVRKITTHVEDGGCGVLPYQVVAQSLFQRSLCQAVSSFERVGLAPPRVAQVEMPSIVAVWRAAFNPVFVVPVRCIRSSAVSPEAKRFGFRSWLNVVPASAFVTLKDEEFIYAMLLRLDLLQPQPYACSFSGKQLSDMSPVQYTNHMGLCGHCSMWSFRHDRVVSTIASSCRWHSTYVVQNPKDMPLVGAEKGGPDALVYLDKIYAVDVSVARDATDVADRYGLSNMDTRFGVKTRKYEAFKQVSGFEILPFCMSVLGIVSERSIGILHQACQRMKKMDLLRDILRHTQFDLIRAMYSARQMLHARSALRLASSLITEAGETEDMEDNELTENDGRKRQRLTPRGSTSTSASPAVRAGGR